MVMRHAERSDYAWEPNDPWVLNPEFHQWPADPPLSEQGIQHAKSVGDGLYNDIQMRDLQDVIIISSPYLRCIQTAAEVCCSFGKTSIFIDNQIGEIWNPDVIGYSNGEKPDIRPCTQGRNWCKDRGVQIEGEAMGSWPSWPEKESEAENRYALRFLQYSQLCKKRRCAFIFVTHGEGVSSMLRAIPEYEARRVLDIEYCGRFITWPEAPDSNERKSSGIHNMCNEVWQLKTQDMTISKERSPTKTCFQQVEKVADLAKRRNISFDRILEAVKVGKWPPSPINTVDEKYFFDSHVDGAPILDSSLPSSEGEVQDEDAEEENENEDEVRPRPRLRSDCSFATDPYSPGIPLSPMSSLEGACSPASPANSFERKRQVRGKSCPPIKIAEPRIDLCDFFSQSPQHKPCPFGIRSFERSFGGGSSGASSPMTTPSTPLFPVSPNMWKSGVAGHSTNSVSLNKFLSKRTEAPLVTLDSPLNVSAMKSPLLVNSSRLLRRRRSSGELKTGSVELLQ